MNIYIYTYLYIYIYIYIYIYTYTYTSLSLSIYIYIHMHTYLSLCLYIFQSRSKYIYMYTYIDLGVPEIHALGIMLFSKLDDMDGHFGFWTLLNFRDQSVVSDLGPHKSHLFSTLEWPKIMWICPFNPLNPTAVLLVANRPGDLPGSSVSDIFIDSYCDHFQQHSGADYEVGSDDYRKNSGTRGTICIYLLYWSIFSTTHTHTH